MAVVPVPLERWCQARLGSRPAEVLFRSGHLSAVHGLRLDDGRCVVVKVRPGAERISGCVVVQRHLWTRGFPCPQPLAGPFPLDGMVATAEAFVADAEARAPLPGTLPLLAALLADLVRLAPAVAAVPTLEPSPPWVGWDHDRPGTWPLTDDRDTDMNVHRGPEWLEESGQRARARLLACSLPPVVGHADWEAHNIGWRDGRPAAVHDWDSVAARPEAALAGAAAAVFTSFGPVVAATVEETRSFLAAYGAARGRELTREERQVAWAAGLWVLAYNAKKESLGQGSGPYLRHLVGEAGERLSEAGA